MRDGPLRVAPLLSEIEQALEHLHFTVQIRCLPRSSKLAHPPLPLPDTLCDQVALDDIQTFARQPVEREEPVYPVLVARARFGLRGKGGAHKGQKIALGKLL